jgi:uncharacterized SAM-binding protein YcdF (DUF218 family)
MVSRVRPDAIVILGCRIGPGGALSGAARRRVDRAVEAFRDGVAGVVVPSGGKRWHGVTEAEALRDALVSAGVPDTAILVERRSLSTRQNARFTAELLRARGAAHVAVVTCDWHLPRALRAFHRVGVRAIGLGAVSPPVGSCQRLLRSSRERVSRLLDEMRPCE